MQFFLLHNTEALFEGKSLEKIINIYILSRTLGA